MEILTCNSLLQLALGLTGSCPGGDLAPRTWKSLASGSAHGLSGEAIGHMAGVLRVMRTRSPRYGTPSNQGSTGSIPRHSMDSVIQSRSYGEHSMTCQQHSDPTCSLNVAKSGRTVIARHPGAYRQRSQSAAGAGGLSTTARCRTHRSVPDALATDGWHARGVIVYSPLQSGLLTDSFNAQALHPQEWRFQNPRFTGEALQRNLKLADALKPVAARHGATVAAVAIAWALAWPGVTGAIVGARNPAQVCGCV
jgi:Aldo/keto reductase family